MNSAYYFDTRSLRDHVSELREEHRVAQHLYESVKCTRDTGNPAFQADYNHILSSIEQLQRYFQKMSETLDNIADDAIKLHQKLESLVQSDNDRLKAINSKINV